MKRPIITLLLLLAASTPPLHADAQQVSKAVLVEHFTNTYCSICAGRNPGFYQNISLFPEVLRISYYPSAPYAACPLNQYNRPEADARTKYYGVYGGTPRLVVQGTAISANANYSSSAIIQPELGKTTPFAANLQLTALNATTGEARFVVRKMDTSNLDSLSIYVAIVEDTLIFNAANGEQKHYNVFRRAVWGQQPLRMKAPVATGDSIVGIQTFPIDATWPLSKMMGIGVVQETSGALVQAAPSGKLGASGPMAVSGIGRLSSAVLHPNPAGDVLYISNADDATATVYNMFGQQVLVSKVDGASPIRISQLAAGHYLVHISDGQNWSNIRLTKR